MRQQLQSMRWLSLVTLVFLGACSQAVRQVSEPSAIATPTETVPATSPLLSATAPTRPPAPTNAVSRAALPIASVTATKPGSTQAAIAKPSAQFLVERTATFQATPRMVGFSPDSNYFIYLESSRDTGAGVPQAALQLVDVAANRCVENGCIETRYGEEAGIKTSAAENNLLQQTWKVRQDLNLTPPVTGTDLPILSRSRSPDGNETVTVQPTNASQPLQLHLRQKKASDKAAMQLEVNYNGQQRSLDSLSNFRTHVLAYAIRQVTLSPDGKRVAVLITTTKPIFEGTLETTLIQGFAL